MKSKALVISTDNDIITVLPVLKEACTACKSGCAKQGESFTVSNPLKLPVKKGSIVFLELSKKTLALQGIISLLVPFLCAIGGYFFGSFLSSKLSINNAEAVKALSVLVFLIISSLGVFLVTRKFPIKGQSEIIEIY